MQASKCVLGFYDAFLYDEGKRNVYKHYFFMLVTDGFSGPCYFYDRRLWCDIVMMDVYYVFLE